MRHRLKLAFAAALLPLAVQAQPAPSALVRKPPAGRSIGVGGFTALSPQQSHGMGQLLLTEHPRYRTPLHVHRQTDESFYVMSGSLTLFVDGKTHHLEPGDYAYIPRGTPHAQGNVTESDAVSLVTLAPADFTAFFAARAELVKTVPPDHPDYPAHMRALGKDHDIVIVGPPPF